MMMCDPSILTQYYNEFNNILISTPDYRHSIPVHTRDGGRAGRPGHLKPVHILDFSEDGGRSAHRDGQGPQGGDIPLLPWQQRHHQEPGQPPDGGHLHPAQLPGQ